VRSRTTGSAPLRIDIRCEACAAGYLTGLPPYWKLHSARRP